MTLTKAQKARLAKADEIIQAAKTMSQQPRFENGVTPGQIFSLTLKWSKEMLEHAPAYQVNSRERSMWLSKFWANEPYLAGLINSVVQIDRNRGWTLVGGRNQVARFSNVLHNWQVAPGQTGWRSGCGAGALSFYTTDIGFLGEVGRQFPGGPMAGLFHFDPTRCILTGNPDYPVRYYPSKIGKSNPRFIDLSQQDTLRVNSMTNIDEAYNGLGYCALSRCMELAITMTAVWQHEQEMLFARAPKGLLLLSGITEDQWKDNMSADAAELDSLEQKWFNNVAVFASGGGLDIDAKLFTLSNLPEGFDQEKFSNLLMYGYSLCFGYDAREFWPVSGGPLGTAAETEVQHRKATDKGGREYWFGLQEQVQANLPPTLHFEADERDTQGEMQDATLVQAKAQALSAIKAALPNLTEDQLMELAAESGIIPREWTQADEDSEATDVTQARKRCLEYLEVQQAIEKFPDEPIVQYRWPQERVQVLYATGRDAMVKFVDMSVPRLASKQARFFNDPVAQRMKKLAQEVEQSRETSQNPAPESQVPLGLMGWIRSEFAELKSKLTPAPTEPMQLTINNPPSPGVQVHNYLDGRPIDYEEQEERKRQALRDELAVIIANNQSTLTQQVSEFVKTNQSMLTSEMLADLKKYEGELSADVLTRLRDSLIEQQKQAAEAKKKETKSFLDRIRSLTNGNK